MIDLMLAAIILLGATGTGRGLLRRARVPLRSRAEELCFCAAAGFAGLSLLLLLLGTIHLLQRWVVVTVTVLWVAAGARQAAGLIWEGRTRAGSVAWSRHPLMVLLSGLAIIGLVLVGIRALAPVHGATDPLAYQLALPKVFLQNGHLSFEPTITGSLYPGNMNLIFAAGLAIRGGVLAQLMHWLMLVVATASVGAFGHRYFGTAVGVWSAAVFSATPLLAVFGPQAYIDVGLCVYQFLAFWALANWLQDRNARMLLLASVLTGIAMGTKHQGLATLALGAPAVFLGQYARGRQLIPSLKALSLYGGVALALACPWYLRAYYYAGNPIWPLANELFGGLPFGTSPVVLSGVGSTGANLLELAMPSMEWLRRYWHSMSPWSWAFLGGGWQKATGIYFVALVPIAVAYLRDRRLVPLLAFCGLYYLILVRALHMNPRYGLVLLAFASVACGYAAHRLSSAWRPVAVAFRGVFVMSMALNLAWEYQLLRPLLPVITGDEGRAQFLRRREHSYAVLDYANRTLPAESKLLLQGLVKGFYSDLSYMWDHPYQSVLQYDQYRTPEELLGRWRELGITHVARLINVPSSRVALGYPQYFADPFHEAFRRQYMRLLHRDATCALFAVDYGASGSQKHPPGLVP
ncbi:ArnT family glycosyltransferase [Candidatus Latescibacterota bacterium]